jgi:hypothetical protein
MTRIAIILGSTRPGRNGEAVANWVYDTAKQRDDAEYELVDIADYDLPHLDLAVHASDAPSAGDRHRARAGRGVERRPRRAAELVPDVSPSSADPHRNPGVRNPR